MIKGLNLHGFDNKVCSSHTLVWYDRLGVYVVAEEYRKEAGTTWGLSSLNRHVRNNLFFYRTKSGPFQVLTQKLEMVPQAVRFACALCLERPNTNRSPGHIYCPAIMIERTFITLKIGSDDRSHSNSMYITMS